jgi:hypothetical protein
MRPHSIARLSVSILTVFLLLVAASPAEEEGEGQAPPDMDAMMAEFAKLATPGPHHEHLGRLVGNWTFTSKYWGPTGGDPMETDGTMVTTWIMGGRFLQTELTTTFMDTPYQGFGIDGYDNGAKNYIAFWLDNMGTMVMQFEGMCENDGKVRTMTAKLNDPMTGQALEYRGVTTVLNDNSYLYESYALTPDGTETKQMELVAKRGS